MKPLAVFGTSSDAGKTTVVMALCRIFADLGLKVAPFKAQNVSNNSAVTQENREISRAQCFQAEAARVAPSYLFNPILLKSYGNSSVQVIVNGLVQQNQTIANYYAELDTLKTHVNQSFATLQSNYDLVIAEGAGSPVELNLIPQDLSNTYITDTFQTKNILVADIERGGVFASIYGTLELMSPIMRRNLIGVVINKFRGDRRFFTEGESIIANRFGIPVLGVLPYLPLNFDMEDSQSLANYRQQLGDVKIRIAVIVYPGLSNYNDLDALMTDSEVHLDLIHYYRPLHDYDMILLPGSKTVIRDLQWLKTEGLFAEIQQFNKAIFGLCGGYQMLCELLRDPNALEHEAPAVETGLGFIADEVVYQSPKILAHGKYPLFSHDGINGYEIHCGRMAKYPLYYQSAQSSSPAVAGTHVHGVFDNDVFRTHYFKQINSHYQGYGYTAYRDKAIQEFADNVKAELNLDSIIAALATC